MNYVMKQSYELVISKKNVSTIMTTEKTLIIKYQYV